MIKPIKIGGEIVATRKPIIATELTRQLEADPEWVARQDERKKLQRQIGDELKQDAMPLIAALHGVGINVGSIWDLVNTSEPYPAALPVLVAHLDGPYDARNREGIARALAVRNARKLARDKVLNIIETRWVELAKDLRDGLMVAICGMASPDDLHKLIDLINDRGLGSSRVFLVTNLMRSRKREAREALLQLKDDPDLEREIAYRLRRSSASGPGAHQKESARIRR
jgi:hypothetical protein